MSSWRLIESSGSSSNAVTGMIPALLITTSSGPSSRSAASRKAAKEPRSVTSSGSAMVPPPSSPAVCSASSRSRSPMATRQPLRTSAVAVALPMPRAPPVIATTLPLSDCRCFAIGYLLLRRPSGRRLVDGDHGGAAEADVVLQGQLRALDLPLVGFAAQLPGQFRALRQAGRAERVALGDQPSRGVDDDLPAEGGRFFLDQLVALALGGEAERFICDELVGAEAVVQLADVDFLGGDAGLGVGLVGCLLGHVGADDLHAVGVLGEGRGEVGDHRLAGDLDRPLAEAVLFDVALGGDDRAGRAVGGGRALQLGQRVVDHPRRLDLLQAVYVLE